MNSLAQARGLADLPDLAAFVAEPGSILGRETVAAQASPCLGAGAMFWLPNGALPNCGQGVSQSGGFPRPIRLTRATPALGVQLEQPDQPVGGGRRCLIQRASGAMNSATATSRMAIPPGIV
jgi:hypothetical protein